MTEPEENLPDIDEARQAVEESQRRAEEDMRRAAERAHQSLSLARWLRKLREANGFGEILDDAFGSSHG